MEYRSYSSFTSVMGLALVVGLGCPGQSDEECSTTGDCRSGEICDRGVCRELCNSTRDCGNPCNQTDRDGEICRRGVCVPGCPDPTPGDGRGDSDAPGDANGDSFIPGDAACPAGFVGAACDACEPEHYGPQCEACTCINATCDDGISGDGSCTCLSGYADCTGGPADGCESYVVSGDPLHCGDCYTACSYANAAGFCADSNCQMGACDHGYDDCNGNAADGCETAIMGTDAAHCGACNSPCLLAQECAGGGCEHTFESCTTPGVSCEQDLCQESGRYAVNANIVVDLTNSRRVWQRQTLSDIDYSDASAFCEMSTLEGLTEWRLPSFAELKSILYQEGGLHGCPTCAPAVDQAAFDSVPSVAPGPFYWTTMSHPAGYERVDFCSGRNNPAAITVRSYALCTHDPVD